MIPSKAVKKFKNDAHREIAAGTLLAYGFFPRTTEGIDQAKKFVSGLDRWIAPSDLPDYYDGIDSDLMTGRETEGIKNIRMILDEFYFGSSQVSSTVEDLPIEEIPVTLEVQEVEVQPDPVSQPDPDPVSVTVEVPVSAPKKAPRRIKLPRQKNRFVRKKQKSLSQRMADSWDKNLLSPLIDAVRNPQPTPGVKPKKPSDKKSKSVVVSNKTFPGKISYASKSSSLANPLASKISSKIKTSFSAAAAARREFKKSGGDPTQLRKGFFFGRAFASEFGGDKLRRTRGTFSRNPDITQDPALSKEERFAAIIARDLASRPTMMKQGELFDSDQYKDKTNFDQIKKLGDQITRAITGLETGFVRMDKSNKETSKNFDNVTKNLNNLRSSFSSTTKNISEFVKAKTQKNIVSKELNDEIEKESEREQVREEERQLDLLSAGGGTIDIQEADQLANQEDQKDDGDDEDGGMDIPDFPDRGVRSRRPGARRRLARRRLGGIGRRISETTRKLGDGIARRGGRAGRFLQRQGSKAIDFTRRQGSRAIDFGRKQGSKAIDFTRRQGSRAIDFGRKQGSKAIDFLAKNPKLLKIGTAFGRFGAKALPGLGIAAGTADAAERASRKDNVGAGIAGFGAAADAIAAGSAATGVGIPVAAVATVASWASDIALLGKDIFDAVTGSDKPKKKMSSGGIIAGEAGNEIIQPLTSSVGRNVLSNLENNGSFLPVIGPLLSASAGVLRNPMFRDTIAPIVDPVIQPLLAKYKVPVYSANLGLFNPSKVKSASEVSKSKSEKSDGKKGGGILGFFGNLFGSIGSGISNFFGGIGNFFSGLFGNRPSGGANNTPYNGPMGSGTPGEMIAEGAKTTYYDPSLGGINASGYKTRDGLPATSTGEGYRSNVFSAAAFPPLLARLPASMTVPARGFPGGRTLKRPFNVIVTNKDGKKAVVRVNDVGPGVNGHSSNHMLDLSVAAKNYLGTGGGFKIEYADANSTPGPLQENQANRTQNPISGNLQSPGSTSGSEDKTRKISATSSLLNGTFAQDLMSGKIETSSNISPSPQSSGITAPSPIAMSPELDGAMGTSGMVFPIIGQQSAPPQPQTVVASSGFVENPQSSRTLSDLHLLRLLS